MLFIPNRVAGDWKQLRAAPGGFLIKFSSRRVPRMLLGLSLVDASSRRSAAVIAGNEDAETISSREARADGRPPPRGFRQRHDVRLDAGVMLVRQNLPVRPKPV